MDSSRLARRQLNDDNSSTDLNSSSPCYFNCSPTAYAIKWAIIAAIILSAGVYFAGGYLHAQRRMKKGLPPLAYHRWLVNRHQQAAFVQQHPQYASQFSFYRAQQAQAGPYGYGYNQAQAYQMGGMYGPPPPAYHEPGYVPPYTGPHKVNPDQHYTAPSGPPPSLTPRDNPAAPEPARVVRWV